MTAEPLTPEFLSRNVNRLCPHARRWIVAFSGGLDSHVLLHLAAHAPDRPELLALHVNHGVQPAARDWSDHCQSVAHALGVEMLTESLALGQGVSEATMRDQRYQVFESLCGPGDVLLMAHHADDQAETVLLRLMRGAGARGLAGIPAVRVLGRGRICRPLLGHSRQLLERYADEHGLRWIEDPSNEDERFDRNFMRHSVLPLLESRWPDAAGALLRSSKFVQEAAAMSEDLARIDAARAVDTDRFGESRLSLDAWQRLSPKRQVNLLRYWIESTTDIAPNADVVDTILETVIGSRPDAAASVAIASFELRRYRQHLHLVDALAPMPEGAVAMRCGESVIIDGVGRVRMMSAPTGIRAGSTYELRFRESGIRCKAVGRVTRSLKDWFQEYGIPPWRRSHVPLLFVDGELAAVADLFICEGHQAGAEESALRLYWSPFN